MNDAMNTEMEAANVTLDNLPIVTDEAVTPAVEADAPPVQDEVTTA